MRSNLLVLWFLLLASFSHALHASQISTEGQRLRHYLDQTDVEHLWPAGVHVAWETGVPDGKPESTEGKHTHCSAFVASVAKHLGIYILRPPEHGQILLANAQFDWLAQQGGEKGWTSVSGGEAAQKAANRGMLVVATYRNHRDEKPGHIAIVRPSEKSDSAIDAEGPQITQAGGTNYASATLKRGFAGHSAAFTRGEVRYYAHPIDWPHVSSH